MDVPSEGFSKNKYGMYEPIELRDKELEAYRRLVKNYPKNTHYKYLLASSYWRSAYFDDAIATYADVVDMAAEFSNASILMLACIFYEQENKEKAQAYLDRHNRIARERGEPPAKDRIEEIYTDQ